MEENIHEWRNIRQKYKENTHHVVVRLFLLLLLGRLSRSGATSRGCRSSRRARTTSTDVGKELLDVLALESLGEEGCPDWLELDVGRVRQREDFLRL